MRNPLMETTYGVAYRELKDGEALLFESEEKQVFSLLKNTWRYWYADPLVFTYKGEEWLFAEKERYDKEMRNMEALYPGSYGMAAQECQACKKCARLSDHPCVHPEIMRYALEALGCFPVQMVKDKLGFDILWSDGTSIPEYYLLVAGVLMK